MLFNSYSFILLFLPVCLLLAAVLRKRGNLQLYLYFLIAASLLFYALHDIGFMAMMVASICLNYFWGGAIKNTDTKKKLVLAGGIAANLLFLFYFKYSGFLVSTVNLWTGSDFVSNVLLPAGISFYTFHQIIYLVDTYRGQIVPHTLSGYILYICFFPQLVAGPIVHQKDFFSQLNDRKNVPGDMQGVALGLTLFSIGLFKKVVIADNIDAMFVAPIFNHSLDGAITFWEGWVGAVGYAFRIYYDFSGYSDMAIGLARCFGIEFPVNFNSPYKAKSLQEFWKRWHITLSNFLRDYLYIPLGGNRAGEIRQYTNVILTMFLAGLWHGAGWGFMIWGFMHGAGIAINHWVRRHVTFYQRWPDKIQIVLAWICTFTFICVAWVAFRAETLHSLGNMWAGMADITQILTIDSALYKIWHAPLLLLLLAHCLLVPNTYQLIASYMSPERLQGIQSISWSWRPSVVWAVTAGVLFYCGFLMLGHVNSFIYFQF